MKKITHQNRANDVITKAFACGRICLATANHFEITLTQAISVLGYREWWEDCRLEPTAVQREISTSELWEVRS